MHHAPLTAKCIAAGAFEKGANGETSKIKNSQNQVDPSKPLFEASKPATKHANSTHQFCACLVTAFYLFIIISF